MPTYYNPFTDSDNKLDQSAVVLAGVVSLVLVLVLTNMWNILDLKGKMTFGALLACMAVILAALMTN